MAVHTHLSKKEILDIIGNYEIGYLVKYSGIKEGIENTNYLIQTSINKFILTLFESRVDKSNIPFYLNLMKHTNKNGLLCPLPISDKKNKLTNIIKKKKYAIFNFIEGSTKKNWSKNDCYEVGKILGKFHKINKGFTPRAKNNYSCQSWKIIFEKCKPKINSIISQSSDLLKNEINFVSSKWPKLLPKGIIHADLFPDNVFFIKKKINGIIDFYFSSYDLLVYDLAILINAWCYIHGKFNHEYFRNIINGYESFRKLNLEEKKNFNIILRGASLRFLLTRIHDSINNSKNNFLNIKDPNEYYNILRYHIKIDDEKSYF